MMAALKKSQDPLYVSLREKMDLYPTVAECLEAVVSGSHAILENIPYIKLMIGRALKVRRNRHFESRVFHQCDHSLQH